MGPTLTREFELGELVVRSAPDGAEQRVIEGTVIPFGEIVRVADPEINGGVPYRETIARSAVEGLDPTRVTVESGNHKGPLVGVGIEADADGARLRMAFRIARTPAGDELLELAREGVYRALSAKFNPIKERRRPDGVIERTAIRLTRVAVLERGAYQGAEVTAIREEPDMPPVAETPTPDPPEPTPDPPEPDPPELERAAAERETVTRIGARTPQASRAGGIELTLERARSTITITRDELVYGPSAGRSWLRDLALQREDPAAAEALSRHYAMLGDLARELERAGDVLSSELGGAYPNAYLPGLLTPRILKGRPMGGFFRRVPISSGQPIIFPKVTTSTTVTAQSAEGVNPAASDFATTATTITPVIYGGETVVSRQAIDGASPGVEQMVMDDLLEAYAQATEAIIKTAIEAGATASGVAVTAATPYAGIRANVVNYYTVRFMPAQAVFIPSALYTVLLAQNDSTGRPLLPFLGPQNADGTASTGGASADALGVDYRLSWASTANVVVTGRESDAAIFESSIGRFSYDAVTGPAGVRIGLWAYLVVGIRDGSLKVTAA